jgi:hypothetical protein
MMIWYWPLTSAGMMIWCWPLNKCWHDDMVLTFDQVLAWWYGTGLWPVLAWWYGADLWPSTGMMIW